MLALAGYGSFVMITGKINNKPLQLTQMIGGPTIAYPQQGGTGTSTKPTAGQFLVGNAGGLYDLISSSSFGFLTRISINGVVSTSFNFTTTSDTNIGLSITTSTDSIIFNPSWTGTLADARITSAATWNAKLGQAYQTLASSTFLTQAYPAIASSSFLNINYPSVASSSFLNINYPAIATSTFMQIAASTTYNFDAPTITIPSSSLVIGSTTTIILGFAVQPEIWNSYGCYTDSASGTVQFGTLGGAYMTAILATSTGTLVPQITMSANNSFATGTKRAIQIGQIVNMPNFFSCTVKKRF